MQINIGSLLRGTKRRRPFAVPRIWRELANHLNDCYFCMVHVCGYKKAKDKKKLVYLNIPSSIAPVPHDEHMPIPVPPTTDKVNMEISDKNNDYMEKQDDKIFAFRLKEWNLLQSTVRITKYLTRHTSYARYFAADKSLCFCLGIMEMF